MRDSNRMDNSTRLAMCREANAQVWAGEAELRPSGLVAGDDCLLLTATGLPVAYWNSGTVLRAPASLAQTLEAARDFFELHRLPYGCLLPSELTACGQADIATAGYAVAEDPHDLMALATDELVGAEMPAALEIRTVRTTREIAEHVAVVAATLGPDNAADDAALMQAFIAPQVGAPGYELLTGYVDGWPVCAATGTRTEHTIGVFGVGTLPGHRRRGYGAAITRAVVEHGFADGAELAWLNPSEMAHRCYAALGFADLPGWSILSPQR